MHAHPHLVLIRFLKSRHQPPIRLPTSEPTESISSARTEESDEEDEQNVPAVDLTLSRLSMITEIAVYIIFPFATAPWGFITTLAINSLGAGFVPAVQALALELYRFRDGASAESGKLFGALSIVRAVW